MKNTTVALLFCLISSIAHAQEPVPAFTDTVMKDTSLIVLGQQVWDGQCRHCHGNSAYPATGPLDVIDEGITGCMNPYLKQAVTDCLFLPRRQVWDGSQRWSWDRAWEIFRNNLVPIV